MLSILVSILLCATPIVGDFANDEVGMLMLNTAVDTVGSFNLSGLELDELQENGEDFLFQESGEDFRNAVGNTESDDGPLSEEFDALAWSYFPDTQGEAPLHVVPAMRIWEFKNSDFDVRNTEDAMDSNIVTTTMKSVVDDVSISLGLGASFLGVSLSVESSNSKILNTNKTTWRTSKIDGTCHREVTRSRKLWSLKTRFQRLYPEIQTALLEETPQSISSKIGAFFPWKVKYGALFKSTFVKLHEKTDDITTWGTTVEVGFGKEKVFSVNSNFSYDNTQKEMNQKTDIHKQTHVIGGNAKELHRGYKHWLNSVTRENMQPIQYSMIPLYELLKAIDLEKGEALEKYQRAKWEESMNRLLSLDVLPISPPPLSTCSGAARREWQYDNTGGTFPYKMGLRVDVVSPQTCHGGELHYALGDVANHDPWSVVPAQGMTMVAGDVVAPVSAEEIWHDNDGWHPGKVWKLSCPSGYVALGHVWTEHSSAVVDLKNYRCIPSRCAKPLKPSQVLFYNYHWVYPPSHRRVRVFHHPGDNMYYYFHAQLGWDDVEPTEVFEIDLGCVKPPE